MHILLCICAATVATDLGQDNPSPQCLFMDCVTDLSPYVPLLEKVVDCEVSHPGGESLVEPEIGPPLHGDEVAKPG